MSHSLHPHISICGCRLVMGAKPVSVSFDVLMAVTMKINAIVCSLVCLHAVKSYNTVTFNLTTYLHLLATFFLRTK